MAVFTRLGASGVPRQLYGDFTGKEAASRDIELYTRLGASGVPRQLYGDFTGKEAALGGRVIELYTRLGASGVPRQLYGDFTGKELAVAGDEAGAWLPPDAEVLSYENYLLSVLIPIVEIINAQSE